MFWVDILENRVASSTSVRRKILPRASLTIIELIKGRRKYSKDLSREWFPRWTIFATFS